MLVGLLPQVSRPARIQTSFYSWPSRWLLGQVLLASASLNACLYYFSRTNVKDADAGQQYRAHLDTATKCSPMERGAGTPRELATETAALRSAGVLAGEFWQRPAASLVVVSSWAHSIASSRKSQTALCQTALLQRKIESV